MTTDRPHAMMRREGRFPINSADTNSGMSSREIRALISLDTGAVSS